MKSTRMCRESGLRIPNGIKLLLGEGRLEKFVEKGKELTIEGKLIHRSYTGKEGTVKYVTEIVLHDLLLMQAARQPQPTA